MKRVAAGTADMALSLVFSSYHKRIDRAVKDIAIAAQLCGVHRHGPLPMRTKKKVWSVIRGPFADKKSQEKFALHTHRRLLHVEGEKDTINRFVNFVVDTLEPSVTVKVFETSFQNLDPYWTFGKIIAEAKTK